MVHPTCAGHVERFIPDREGAGGSQSGEGIVVGGLSSERTFVADPVDAMYDRRFLRRDREVEGHIALCGLEDLCVWGGRRRFGAPPIDPGVEPIGCRTGLAQAGSAHLVRIVKCALAEIADGKVGHV